jgi:hypothetical protein
MLFSFCVIYGCRSSTHKVEWHTESTFVKGVSKNGMMEDTFKYYSLDGTLLSAAVYMQGKLNGDSIEYYSDGKIKKRTSFLDTLKNGSNRYYDTFGNLIYSDFFYYNLSVGPIIYYENKVPKKFYFSNLENENLLSIDYGKWDGIQSIVPNLINFTLDIIKEDTTRKISLLLYIIQPPKIKVEYTINTLAVNSEADYKEVEKVQANLPFTHLTLPVLNNQKYFVGARIYDSMYQKETVIYREI